MLDPTLAALIEAKIPGQRYGVFFSVGEGRFFPNGREMSSGFVVAEDGCHFFYWTGWDAKRGRERLSRWCSAPGRQDDGSMYDGAEYLAARRAAGLPDHN